MKRKKERGGKDPSGNTRRSSTAALAQESCLAARMAEEQGTVVDGIVGEFSSYEDYLDSQISPTDLYYLEDEDLARQLVVSLDTPRAILNGVHIVSRPPFSACSHLSAGARLPRQWRDSQERGV